MRALLPLALALALVVPAGAMDAKPPITQSWSFQGPFGTFDRASLQRGFQVYREVCSACHGLTFLRFHDLAAPGGPGFTRKMAQAIAAGFSFPAGPNDKGEEADENGSRFQRPGRLSDAIPFPFANEALARESNNGALPPDLTLMTSARPGGPDYVYSIVVGFAEKPPHGLKLATGMSYNPYFQGRAIAMVQPLTPDTVEFSDGTKATLEQEARDVVTFLAWAADPHAEARKRLGFEVIAFLILLSGLLFLSYRKVWKDQK